MYPIVDKSAVLEMYESGALASRSTDMFLKLKIKGLGVDLYR
jgi:hypothetical protein